MPEPRKDAPLPTGPWKTDRGVIGDGGSGLIAVTITDADGNYLVSVRGDHADAFADLLLRAPQVEQAAREAVEFLENCCYEVEDMRAVVERLQMALGEQK